MSNLFQSGKQSHVELSDSLGKSNLICDKLTCDIHLGIAGRSDVRFPPLSLSTIAAQQDGPCSFIVAAVVFGDLSSHLGHMSTISARIGVRNKKKTLFKADSNGVWECKCKAYSSSSAISASMLS